MKNKSQEQIRFENLYTSHYGGWWKNYSPKSIGNIIHWIYVFGTLTMAETVTIGDNKIYWHGNLLMKFKYLDDMPYFYELQDEKYQFIIDNQEIYLKGLKKFSKFVKEIDEKYSEIKQMLNN